MKKRDFPRSCFHLFSMLVAERRRARYQRDAALQAVVDRSIHGLSEGKVDRHVNLHRREGIGQGDMGRF
ncbi:MAG: hypothetical protein A2Z25_05450 [Planctomycetes bacterium RBG_16_55_9]|nr:MAG: hypothetical protein A2Z25_05450 [Planctomycetes bacterium RBG_16_55_9]